jgi:uncharacterized protein (UPF0128 family)
LDVFLDVLKKDSNFFDSKKGPKSGDKAISHPSDFRIIMHQNVPKNNKLMAMFRPICQMKGYSASSMLDKIPNPRLHRDKSKAASYRTITISKGE